MRKFFLLLCSLGIAISCSDGDLQIEVIDFNDITPQSCSSADPASSNILFKINDTEALILNLQSGVLNNGVVGETVTTESEVPGGSTLTFRVFSGGVTSNYFCDAIPPATPTVIEEINATDGSILIETVIDADTTNFVHTIRLSEITFVNAGGERITNLTIDEFGEVTTTIPVAN
ncbi:hypothetical protein [Flagellimonas allohymeniacidonis]|uniref:Uncharacterized protein n=1 Tax=Flagellimonas allohymeniacidonis TaxID=2517819 RepID=A0A4Q8QM18_9FLAO|nr:hypothetical protein [Allomuricauda hymeniacidonis]TAI49346.1 hypothetical protein EW142_05995 [Allomuricauda hymeniacidonis]